MQQLENDLVKPNFFKVALKYGISNLSGPVSEASFTQKDSISNIVTPTQKRLALRKQLLLSKFNS